MLACRYLVPVPNQSGVSLDADDSLEEVKVVDFVVVLEDLASDLGVVDPGDEVLVAARDHERRVG